MLGYKIRQLRIQRGLSQQQLANGMFTRAYISQVENGKCQPSVESLKVIAERLGKSISYFLQDEAASMDSPHSILDLLQLAESALRSGATEDCRSRAQQALRLSHDADRLDLAGRAHLLIARYHYRSTGLLDSAIEECEKAVESFRLAGHRQGQAEAYAELGNCFYWRDDYLTALRHYEKSLHWSEGIKSASCLRHKVRSHLAATLHRLGQTSEAVAQFRAGLKECSELEDPGEWAKLAMGLGMIYLKSGDTEQARQWTQKAIHRMTASGDPRLFSAKHNLGIIELARNNWETAYSILMDCLRYRRQTGELYRQASVLEDLCAYWLARNDLNAAERCCNEALSLVAVGDHGVLRGSLYRYLGRIEMRRGNPARAVDMFRMSLEILERIRVREEAAETALELAQANAVLSSPTGSLRVAGDLQQI